MKKYLVFFISFMFLLSNASFVFASKQYNLTLEEVTTLALVNNFDIQLAKYDAWIAKTRKGEVESIYDTILSAEVEYRNNQQGQTSTIAGTKTLDNDYNIGLSKKLPIGTTVELDLENNRNWNNSAFTTSPLTHDSTLGATVTQELGKNFLGIQDRNDIKITRLDIENSEYTSLTKIEESISQVQKAYWDLVLEKERVSIREDMAAQAKRLYDLHQEKLKDGLVELPEAIAAQANYESQKNNLITARNQFERKVNILKLLLNIEEEQANIDPSEELVLSNEVNALVPNLNDAFTYRRDYKGKRNQIEAKDLSLSMKKNSLWPQINLKATLEKNGLGDHFKQAVQNINEEDNPNFFAGLEIVFPLENTKERAQLKAAELEKAKALVDLKLLERTISIEVIDQVRDCNIFYELATNNVFIAKLQKEKLEEEEKRFRYGRSDTDMIIRFQEDLLLAREKEALAKQQYYYALIDLKVKTGVLLDKYWEDEL